MGLKNFSQGLSGFQLHFRFHSQRLQLKIFSFLSKFNSSCFCLQCNNFGKVFFVRLFLIKFQIFCRCLMSENIRSGFKSYSEAASCKVRGWFYVRYFPSKMLKILTHISAPGAHPLPITVTSQQQVFSILIQNSKLHLRGFYIPF